MQEGIATVEGDARKLAGPCDGTRDRAQKSAARRKCPKRTVFSLQERMGAGQAGYIGANHPALSQRLRNGQNKLFANGVAVPAKQATALRNDRLPRSGLGRNGVPGCVFYRQPFKNKPPATASLLQIPHQFCGVWVNQKERKKRNLPSLTHNPHVAVFNNEVCSFSQSSIELKLIPSVSNKTFYDLFGDREDCFLAVFDHAVEELAAARTPYSCGGSWRSCAADDGGCA
jgi:hypothetical protein